MNDIFEKIKSQLNSKYPFAIYCKPGSSTATGIFQNDNVMDYKADFTREGFVFAPFHDGKRLFIPTEAAEINTFEIEPEVTKNELYGIIIDQKEKNDFELIVREAVGEINNSELQKVVLSRKQEISGSVDIEKTLKKILQAYPKAFRYFFYHPVSGMWMGATPERLLNLEGIEMSTVALAGTQLYKEGEEAVWEEKEKLEQKFVTDFITNSIGDYVTDIYKTEPYTFRAGNIVHIRTDISGKVKDASNLSELIEALHPTPAICGLPKDTALQFIQKNEKYEREYYSGFLGEINFDQERAGMVQTDLFVNLRCMKLQKSKVSLFVGCGIIKNSNPEKEFVETVNKATTMAGVLTLKDTVEMHNSF